MSSVRELRVVLGSADAITIFSVRHRSHLLVPHLYGAARLAISHLMMGSSPESFSSHMYLDKRVGLSESLCLNE